jgi:hypothetical protein
MHITLTAPLSELIESNRGKTKTQIRKHIKAVLYNTTVCTNIVVTENSFNLTVNLRALPTVHQAITLLKTYYSIETDIYRTFNLLSHAN